MRVSICIAEFLRLIHAASRCAYNKLTHRRRLLSARARCCDLYSYSRVTAIVTYTSIYIDFCFCVPTKEARHNGLLYSANRITLALMIEWIIGSMR